MLRKLFILIVCAVAAASVPVLYERNPELFHGLIAAEDAQVPPPTIAKAEIRTSEPAEPVT